MIDENEVSRVNLFAIPTYKIRFKDHEKYKKEFIDYIENVEGFPNTARNTLQFTTANLHKTKVFKPFTDFVHSSLEYVMQDCGWQPSIKVTGIWSTKHEEGGFHHQHTHHNSMWGGVYYLEGTENNSGTTFYNPIHYHAILDPAHIKGKPRRFLKAHTSKFEEGMLVIFPAWLEHTTDRNVLARTGSIRRILSFNAMPVGKTTYDPFDRYNYPDPTALDMMTYYEGRDPKK
jgi:uncharacterized protein (TIGR02466 family)